MPTIAPRGPLPARTYWIRRLVVLAVPLVLIVLIGSLLTGGSDGQSDSSAGETAGLAGSDARASGSGSATGTATDEAATDEPTDQGSDGEAREPLAQPDGECEARDVTVDPRVVDAVAGRDVRIRLRLRTTGRDACTWSVSPDTLTMKITSGSDDVWSSQECSDVLPTQDVVVRAEHTTKVVVLWDARRSDEGCTNQRQWSMPGTYHVTAAALAGDPTEERFLLEQPTPETMTAAPDPKQDKNKKRKPGSPGQQESAPTAEPLESGSPSGAVEPNR